MPSPKPALCRQREKNRPGCAFIRIKGKKIVLGVYGSAEARRRYAELVDADKPADEPTFDSPAEPTASELIAAYVDHASRYYQNLDGTMSR